jgi:hypothetical protein
VRTHNLNLLLTQCLAAGGPFARLQADCAALTPHAVMLRYPAGTPDPGEAEGREAVAAAHRIHAAVRAGLTPAPPAP